MAAELKVKSGGIWRTITDPEVKLSGVWRAIKTIEVKSGGVWREVFALVSGPVVSPLANGDSNMGLAPCYAGVQFNTSGVEYEYTPTGGLGVVGDGWLDSGASSEVWVERIVTAGSWSSIDPGAGRHQLSTTRSFRVESWGGTSSVTGYFKFWDAATGGSLLHQSASAIYSARVTL